MSRMINLLVVDDEIHNQNEIQEILNLTTRFMFKVASSGEEKLAVLETYSPDIILLAVVLPGLGGYEICKIIRADSKHNYVKILLVSGHSSGGDNSKWHSGGVL